MTEIADLTCRHCHGDLQNANAYEDGVYGKLVEWLCAISCIPWVRCYPDFRRPDCREGQYGSISISRYRLISGGDRQVGLVHVDAVDDAGNPLTKSCCLVEETEEVTLELEVFLEHGEASDCVQDGIASPDKPFRSASDVLRHIRRMFRKVGFVGPLNDCGIDFMRHSDISSGERLVDSVWAQSASMSVALSICTVASYPVDGSLFFYCVVGCGGEPLCVAPVFNCV